MRTAILLGLTSLLGTASCNNVTCGPGTIERGGKCEPADVSTGTAACGPFTMLEGTQCVPMFPPTVCDPATTAPDTDPTTGVTTCIGTGGGGCSAKLACPAGSAGGKQTICGQIYDLATGMKFAAPMATGAKCAAGATSGPCALAIQAYDAQQFATNPATAQPLANGGVYIDDCGRYRLTDVSIPSTPLIGLGFDDANTANMGPPGVTNAVGTATPVTATSTMGTASEGVEGFIVTMATTDGWASSGGPTVGSGIYTALFRAHMCDMSGTCTGDPFATEAGVTITKSGTPQPSNDYYFQAADTTLTTIDSAATATGANGAGLYIGAALSDGFFAYSGTGGIADTTNCQWEQHAAASLPNIVLVQIFRPQNKPLHTCTQ